MTYRSAGGMADNIRRCLQVKACWPGALQTRGCSGDTRASLALVADLRSRIAARWRNARKGTVGMTMRQKQTGAGIRRELGRYVRLDVASAAGRPTPVAWAWPFGALREMRAGDGTGVAQRLGRPPQLWVIVRAIGHRLLRPGNHLRMQRRTRRGPRAGRNAGGFEGALPMSGREAVEPGLIRSWGVDERSCVPEVMARCHGPLGRRMTGYAEVRPS